MPGPTSKSGTEPPVPPAGGIPDEDLLDDTEEELAADHVVRRFFATHERDLRPGIKRHPGNEGSGGRPAPRPGPRRRRTGPGIDDEG